MAFVIVKGADAAALLSGVASATKNMESNVSIANLEPEEFIDFCQQQNSILFFGDAPTHEVVMNVTGVVMRRMRSAYSYNQGDIAVLLDAHNSPNAEQAHFVMIAPCLDQSYSIKTSGMARQY